MFFLTARCCISTFEFDASFKKHLLVSRRFLVPEKKPFVKPKALASSRTEVPARRIAGARMKTGKDEESRQYEEATLDYHRISNTSATWYHTGKPPDMTRPIISHNNHRYLMPVSICAACNKSVVFHRFLVFRGRIVSPEAFFGETRVLWLCC